MHLSDVGKLMKFAGLSLCVVMCPGVHGQAESGMISELLLRQSVEGVPTKEVIVSKVRIPPNTELPWHWHHGEEVFYVLEGEVSLLQRGKPGMLSKAGESNAIAPGVIHTGRTGEEGVYLVIFRVHDKGKPERILVD